jgi:putative NADH-flavin reductase
MKFFVLGATGATGREFVKQALAAGHSVTAFVRNANRIEVQSPNLVVVTGTVDDVASLSPALGGHNAIVSMLGNGTGRNDKTLIDDSTAALVRAADLSGVHRIVIMSAFGVGDSQAKASWLAKQMYRRGLGKVYADKVRGESRLKDSDLDWTLVYPVLLTNKNGSGKYAATPLEQSGKIRGLPRVSRADVATFLLETAVNGSFTKSVVVIQSA